MTIQGVETNDSNALYTTIYDNPTMSASIIINAADGEMQRAPEGFLWSGVNLSPYLAETASWSVNSLPTVGQGAVPAELPTEPPLLQYQTPQIVGAGAVPQNTTKVATYPEGTTFTTTINGSRLGYQPMTFELAGSGIEDSNGTSFSGESFTAALDPNVILVPIQMIRVIPCEEGTTDCPVQTYPTSSPSSDNIILPSKNTIFNLMNVGRGDWQLFWDRVPNYELQTDYNAGSKVTTTEFIYGETAFNPFTGTAYQITDAPFSGANNLPGTWNFSPDDPDGIWAQAGIQMRMVDCNPTGDGPGAQQCPSLVVSQNNFACDFSADWGTSGKSSQGNTWACPPASVSGSSSPTYDDGVWNHIQPSNCQVGGGGVSVSGKMFSDDAVAAVQLPHVNPNIPTAIVMSTLDVGYNGISPCADGEIAEAYTTVNAGSGVEAPVMGLALNGSYVAPTSSEGEPLGIDSSVITAHELGHLFGLNHIDDPNGTGVPDGTCNAGKANAGNLMCAVSGGNAQLGTKLNSDQKAAARAGAVKFTQAYYGVTPNVSVLP